MVQNSAVTVLNRLRKAVELNRDDVDPYDLERLYKGRRLARLTFWLALFFSLGANYVHAPDSPTLFGDVVSKAVAMWPPLGLLAVTELVLRIPFLRDRKWLGMARAINTIVVGGIAGFVSYRHMEAVARTYGDYANAHLFPISVDGTMIVAGISLVFVEVHLSRVRGRVRQEAAVEREREHSLQLARASVQIQATQPTQQPVVEQREVVAEATPRPKTPREKVLRMMDRYPDATATELSRLARVSYSTAKNALASLKDSIDDTSQLDETELVPSDNGRYAG